MSEAWLEVVRTTPHLDRASGHLAKPRVWSCPDVFKRLGHKGLAWMDEHVQAHDLDITSKELCLDTSERECQTLRAALWIFPSAHLAARRQVVAAIDDFWTALQALTPRISERGAEQDRAATAVRVEQ